MFLHELNLDCVSLILNDLDYSSLFSLKLLNENYYHFIRDYVSNKNRHFCSNIDPIESLMDDPKCVFNLRKLLLCINPEIFCKMEHEYLPSLKNNITDDLPTRWLIIVIKNEHFIWMNNEINPNKRKTRLLYYNSIFMVSHMFKIASYSNPIISNIDGEFALLFLFKKYRFCIYNNKLVWQVMIKLRTDENEEDKRCLNITPKNSLLTGSALNKNLRSKIGKKMQRYFNYLRSFECYQQPLHGVVKYLKQCIHPNLCEITLLLTTNITGWLCALLFLFITM